LETQQLITQIIAILAIIGNVLQYFLNRRNQRKDNLLEKRFDVYTSYLSKMDEVNQNLRINPNTFFGIQNDFLEKILTGNEEDSNQALLDYNAIILDQSKQSLKPFMILNNELNKLKLICSKELLPKIEEYKKLSEEFLNETQQVLTYLSSKNDNELIASKLEELKHEQRVIRIPKLWKEIETIMRRELGT